MNTSEARHVPDHKVYGLPSMSCHGQHTVGVIYSPCSLRFMPQIQGSRRKSLHIQQIDHTAHYTDA